MSPAQAAHLRLVESLPKRTHEWKAWEHVQGSKKTPGFILDGKRYASLSEASRILKRSRSALRGLVSRGLARYA